MPYWHIRCLLQDKKNNTTSYSHEMDLSENDVRMFERQLQQQQNVFWGGRWVEPSDIIEHLVFRTEEHSSSYETPRSVAGTEIFDLRKGMDVTRQFVLSPMREVAIKRETKPTKVPNISENVFIVHGREVAPASELARIVHDLGLKPIILSEQVTGSRTILEKLEKYSDVGFAFVILTPDDIGGLADDKASLQKRARQNVILEFGYFAGILGRDRVHCLYKGEIELPSDMLGINYTQFSSDVKEVYWYIVKQLKAVGYSLDSA